MSWNLNHLSKFYYNNIPYKTRDVYNKLLTFCQIYLILFKISPISEKDKIYINKTKLFEKNNSDAYFTSSEFIRRQF